MLFATWSVRAKSMTGGVVNPTTVKTANILVTCIHHPHGASFAAHVRQSFQHTPSLHCQPRTTSRRAQHADRDRHSKSHAATRDMCLDCLVAARTDLGMNWRRTFSECFQSVFTAWRSCVGRLVFRRGLNCAHNHNNKWALGSRILPRQNRCHVPHFPQTSASLPKQHPQSAAAQQEAQPIAIKQMHNHQRVFAVERHSFALERPS